MSQRDSGWIQLFAETNQEAADLHIQAFRLAEELSLPVMVCMDGFILTHAFEASSCHAGAGRRVPAAVRAAPGARPRRADDDRRHGRAGGVHRGPVPHARQADAGARRDPAVAGEFAEAFGRESGGLVRSYRTEDAETVVVALGSVLGTIEDVVDELRDAGRARRRVARQVLPALAARRGPRRARARPARRRARRRRSRSALGGIVGQNVRLALSGLPAQVYDVVAGLGGRPVTKASLQRLLADAARRWARPAHLPRPRRRARRARAGAGDGDADGPGPHAENMLRDIGIVAGGAGLMPPQPIKYYQVGLVRGGQPPARGRTSARCSRDPAVRTRSPPATAPARAAARRSAPATRSTRRCAPPAGS